MCRNTLIACVELVLCRNIYIYTYIYIHTHTHIYIHTYLYIHAILFIKVTQLHVEGKKSNLCLNWWELQYNLRFLYYLDMGMTSVKTFYTLSIKVILEVKGKTRWRHPRFISILTSELSFFENLTYIFLISTEIFHPQELLLHLITSQFIVLHLSKYISKFFSN